MVDLMKQAIEALKAKVNSNLEEIKTNEILFRKFFSEGKAKDCPDDMNKILEDNKRLLAENFDFINVQLSLLKFLEKYKLQEVYNETRQEETITKPEEPEQINYFELTISGKLTYNEEHPMFDDIAFFNNIMSYFESHENYEKCAGLLKAKNSSKNQH